MDASYFGCMNVMKYSVVAFFVLAIACVVYSGQDPAYGKTQALSEDIATHLLGQPVTHKAIYPFESHQMTAAVYNMGTTRSPQDAILFWRHEGDRLLLAHRMVAEQGETFSKPQFFTIQEHTFVNIATDPAGSGGFVRDLLFWVAPDRTLHEVNFRPASEIFEEMTPQEQVVVSGGEKEFYVDDDTMHFQFWLAEPGDPHCCPSGGIVNGTYRLSGSAQFDSFRRQYTSNFTVLPDDAAFAKELSVRQAGWDGSSE